MILMGQQAECQLGRQWLVTPTKVDLRLAWPDVTGEEQQSDIDRLGVREA